MGSSSQAAWNPLESIQNTASHLGDNLNEKEPEFCLHCRWLKPHCVSSFLFLAVATQGISTSQPLMYKHKALSAPLYSNFLSFCWSFLLRRNSRRNAHSWTLYSIHTWQRLMFSVDETGPGFSPRLFFLTMSYTMKTFPPASCSYSSVSGIMPLKASAFLVNFQNWSGSRGYHWVSFPWEEKIWAQLIFLITCLCYTD